MRGTAQAPRQQNVTSQLSGEVLSLLGQLSAKIQEDRMASVGNQSGGANGADLEEVLQMIQDMLNGGAGGAEEAPAPAYGAEVSPPAYEKGEPPAYNKSNSLPATRSSMAW